MNESNSKHTNFLIIGAGPFGLSMASYCKRYGMDYLIVGKPMSFWKKHMPKGMILRSDCEWHLDPQDEYTIDRYLQTKNLTRRDVEPLSLDFYLGYAEWFQGQIGANIQESLVTCLDTLDYPEKRFRAELDDGSTITARNVLLAIGFKYFKNLPPELTQIIREGSWTHTCDLVDFEPL